MTLENVDQLLSAATSRSFSFEDRQIRLFCPGFSPIRPHEMAAKVKFERKPDLQFHFRSILGVVLTIDGKKGQNC